MKNRTIRFKITLWYTAALVLIAVLIFLVIRLAGIMVLRSTIRDYLIGVVEENVEEITYSQKKDINKTETDSHIYIPYSDGTIIIDEDFMDTVSDVNSAIYTKDGKMLYGENPLALETDALPFVESHVWRMKVNGVNYNLYDRKLNLKTEHDSTLWIRGIVSEEENIEQLNRITNMAMVIMPVLILLAVVFGYFLSGRMLSPVRQLEQTASRISMGTDLKERIEVSDHNDELSKLAKVFNDMLSRLEGSFEKERRFTSDASHELRTPMAVILAQCELVLEKDRTEEEYRDALKVIQRQGKRMSSLINDMLDYTRMEQGADRYAFYELSLSALLNDVVNQFRLIGSQNITLESNISPGIMVNGNKELLERMIQNLINNAYKYGKENGNIFVALKMAGTDSKYPELSVKDDGIGISDKDKKNIFNRFYRCDTARNVAGTGLGLSMVKKIAELHGAEIQLNSNLGEGSEFVVEFKNNYKL